MSCNTAGAEETIHYYRGRVIYLESSKSPHCPATTEQKAEVLLIGGKYAGKLVVVHNTYIEGDIYLNVLFEKGMDLILVATEKNGSLSQIYFHDVARERGIVFLLGIFTLLLLLVGKKQGLKTIITMIFTGIVIVKIILPLILAGYDPVLVTTVSAIIIIIFTLLFIGGTKAKTFAAILGSVCGVIIAGFLALWAGEMSYLTGFSSEEAQMLFFMDKPVDIRGLLFAGIIIGSLGAITDAGISVASAAAEIKRANKRISTYNLITAALNVGRDIIGTMSNTLVLAYVGGATPLLLLLLGDKTPWLRIINLDLIATEVVRGVAGSIGLIISVPVTAVVAGLLMARR